jgi:tetratricopeptide (TPR) repeat protein
MLHCIVEFNMHIVGVAVTAVALMALLAAQIRFATEYYWMNPGRIGKILLTVLAAAALAYLSKQGLRKGEQIYWLGQAKAEQTRPDGVLACVSKAQQAEPMDWEEDYKIGDYLWSLSLLDGSDYKDRARQAMAWYTKSMQLNRFDAYAPVACGMCLDRMGDVQEATGYFLIAIRNDPRNTYVCLETARHCIELGELAAAKQWILNGAFKWDATQVAAEEFQKLEQLMADPLFVAGADQVRTNRTQAFQQEIAPLLEGPK